MRRLFTILSAVLALSAGARQITPDEATTVALEFFNGSTPSRAAGRIAVTRVLPPAATAPSRATSDDPASPYYVFNADSSRGFVIISGDDRARKILGYSDTGSFDFTNLPPQLSAMLDQYSEQIATLSGSAADPSWSAPSRSDSDSAEGVLLETANWGQGYPYNAQCPEIDGVRCPTGCVATAMAIVMKYHNWPPKARSFNIILEDDVDKTFDFEQYSFNFEKLPLYFNEKNDEQNIEKISKLMYAVGRSVHMDYGSVESGAYFQIVSHELQEKFSYSPQCLFLMQSDYSWEEWAKIIIHEIENHRPILYAGFSNNSSKHAFVCDGYSADGLFHINWGWNGIDNGFFSLDNNLYSNFPSMVVNIQPDKSGTLYARPYTLRDDIYTLFEEANHINASVSSISQGTLFDIGSPTIRVPYRFNGDLGFALTDNSGKIKDIIGTFNVDGGGYQPYLAYGLGKDFQLYGVSTLESVERTDKIQLIARESETDEWRLVIGCSSIPSSMQVEGCNNKMVNVSVSFDPQLVIERLDQATGNIIPVTEGSFSQLFGSHVDLRCHIEREKTDCYGIVSISGKGAYSDNNSLLCTPYDDRAYAFKAIDDYYSVVGKVFEYSAPLSIIVETAGTLIDLIGIDDANKVSDLTIKGNINAYDLWYIRENMKGLKRLDLSNAKIHGVNTSEITINSFVVSEYQPEDAMPDWALEHLSLLNEVKLPSNLKYLMNTSLSGLRITSITLPATLIDFGFNNFFVCENLDEIINLNPTPVPIRDCNFTGTKCPDRGSLFVPKESISDYKEAPVWKDFKNIYAIGTILPQKIEFAEPSITLGINESKTLQVSFFPENSDITYLRWESDNVDVVTVSEDGTITGLNYGSTFVHAYTTNNKIADCLVSVEKILVNQIILTPEYLSGKVGDNLQISAQILPVNTENKTINWTTSDTSIASVGDDGLVTLLKEGTCIITATATDGSGVSATCKVTVRPVLVESLTIDPENWDGFKGDSFSITATVLPEHATDKTIVWTSSNPDVATVDENGNVTVHKEGSCVIKATTHDGTNIEAECMVAGRSSLDSIFADKNSKIDIYSIKGTLLKHNCTREEFSKLEPGVYVLRQGGKATKFVVK